MAHTVFRGKVHIGYLAAIVAASNAGGSGSVVGDTTTTMMWIDGVSPLAVLARLRRRGGRAGRLRHSRRAAAAQVLADPEGPRRAARRSTGRGVGIVAFILVAAIAANVIVNIQLSPTLLDRFPFIGAAVWAGDPRHGAAARAATGALLPEAFKGTVFLLSLVICASMMPVEQLPAASWQTAFGLGFVSAVFDNIPLTALALKQGGYDWGMLAYAVGFGGSMIWFGSSAGVAMSNMYPEAKSVGRWLSTAGTSRWPTSSASSCCWRCSAGSRRPSAATCRAFRRQPSSRSRRCPAEEDFWNRPAKAALISIRQPHVVLGQRRQRCSELKR